MDRIDEEMILLKDIQKDIKNLNIDIINENLSLITENERLSNQNFDLRTEVERQKESIVRHIKNEGVYIKKINWAKEIIESARNGLNHWMDAFPLVVEECDYVMLNEMSDWQEQCEAS